VERLKTDLSKVTERTHPVNIVIVQVYMLTVAHEEEEMVCIIKMIVERLENIKEMTI